MNKGTRETQLDDDPNCHRKTRKDYIKCHVQLRIHHYWHGHASLCKFGSKSHILALSDPSESLVCTMQYFQQRPYGGRLSPSLH